MTTKKIASSCLVPYVAWLIFAYQYHFIDGANLLIHEVGHALFLPFGMTLHMWGGTLFQLFVPAAVVCYLFRRRDYFGSAVCCIWLGESLMYTARYLGDAMTMRLPLVGGHLHDWNWILCRLGILRYCEGIAFVIHVLASMLILGAVVFLVITSFSLPTQSSHPKPIPNPYAQNTQRNTPLPPVS